MFKLDPDPTFPLTVDIPRPGGAPEPLTLSMRWMELKEYVALCETAPDGNDQQFLDKLIAGWDADRPYSLEELGRFLAFRPKAGMAIFLAYKSELLGVEEKN